MTITGTGFGDDPSLVLVLIGDVVCVVTSTSSEEVTCELGEGVAGNKQVFLQVSDETLTLEPHYCDPNCTPSR